MQESLPDLNIQIQPEVETKTPQSRKKIGFILGIIVVVISILAIVFVFRISGTKTDQPVANTASVISTPTPTPMPFKELTIPYLRSRSYKSRLEDLQKILENQNYTSYLTSYDSDGFKINGLLTVPQGQQPNGGWPAVIFIHGYIPPQQYRTTQNYASYVDFLARNGLVVFKIDLRGHDTSEGEASGAYFSEDYVIDTLNAYAALQSASFVNPSKIGLWGHSMAGNIVMRAFAAKPYIPAVVIWAGAVYTYTDFQEYGIQDNSYQPPRMDSERVRKRQQLFDIYGQPSADSVFWQQVAPVNYLQDLKGAIQIHHAVNDNVVNIGYSRNLNTLLNSTSVPHELYEYSNGGHNLTGSTFSQAMQRTVEFYKKYLSN